MRPFHQLRRPRLALSHPNLGSLEVLLRAGRVRSCPEVARQNGQFATAARVTPLQKIPFPLFRPEYYTILLDSMKLARFDDFKAETTLDEEDARVLYKCYSGWRAALVQRRTNDAQLLDDIGVSPGQFHWAAVYREQYPTPFDRIRSKRIKDKEAARVLMYPSNVTVGMLLHTAASGYEPSILSLANLIFERHVASEVGDIPIDPAHILRAAQHVAEKGDNPDALTLYARIFHFISAVPEAEKKLRAEGGNISRDPDLLLDRALELGDAQEREGGMFSWRTKALIEKGWLRLKVGDAAAAVEWFERAAKEAPRWRDATMAIAIARSEPPEIAYKMMFAAFHSGRACDELADMLVKAATGGRGGQTQAQVLAEEWQKLARFTIADLWKTFKKKKQ